MSGYFAAPQPQTSLSNAHTPKRQKIAHDYSQDLLQGLKSDDLELSSPLKELIGSAFVPAEEDETIPAASGEEVMIDASQLIADSQAQGEPLAVAGEEDLYWQEDASLEIEEALVADASQFDQPVTAEKATNDVSQSVVQPAVPLVSIFTTARGSAVAAPSKEAMDRAARLLQQSPSPNEQQSFPSQIQSQPPASATMPPVQSLQTSSKGTAAQILRAPLQTLRRDNNATPTNPRAFRPPSRVNVAGRPEFRPPLQLQAAPTPRLPKQAALRNMSQSLAQHQPSSQSPSQLSTPRQIDLRMSGTSHRSSQNNRPKFTTPFKNGQRPSQAQLDANAKAIRLRSSQQTPSDSASNNAKPQAQALVRYDPSKSTHTVFSLLVPLHRQTWDQAGLHPGLSAYALKAFHLPSEIIYIDSLNGKDIFFTEARVEKGYLYAFQALMAKGLKYINLPWVLNHWQLILWKLANIIKAKPEDLYELWRYDVVWLQLLYRYEREINRVQRSAIKRIQEQDSPASRPMVLVVSQIFWQEPVLEPNEAAPPADIGPEATAFELSDGWYRIGAKIDPVLAYAAKRGKIEVGTKIAMAGARLEASREGTEVLDAFDSSTLVLSGNATCQAMWDAKLGFQKAFYVANLRSLSPEGGIARLLDLTILKIYPIGYTRPGEEGFAEGPWSVRDEAGKQKAWENERAKAHDKTIARMQRDIEIFGHLEQDLLRILPAAPASTAEGEDDMSDFLDSLLEAKKWKDEIAKLNKSQNIELRRLVADRYAQARDSATGEIINEIDELCPPRELRSFRVIRVRDSQAPDNGMEAQVTLWDVSRFEHLNEGLRYWVTNLKPARPNGWARSTAKVGEIFLSASKASSFTPHNQLAIAN